MATLPLPAKKNDERVAYIREAILGACNLHDELVARLNSAQIWIDRARRILTPDQQGFCGFHSDNDVRAVLAKAGK